MTVIQRRTTFAVALTLGVMSAPALLAQRTGGPDANTPRLLVAVFASSDKASGVQTADAIRTRISGAASVRSLYVIPKNDITRALVASGFPPDTSLGLSDLKQLGQILRAEELLGGQVTRTSAGFRIEPRLMLARDPALAQPLPIVEAGNPMEAARQVEKSYMEARKQLADNRACENGIRDGQYDKALAAANAGIAKYPNATIARLCLASALQARKASPDEVLKVTDEIIRLDPKNGFAPKIALGAYQAKGDAEGAVNALLKLIELDPGNPTLQAQVVTELAKLGKPDRALPIVDRVLAENPGDPQFLKLRWQLMLRAAAEADSTSRAARFGEAVKSGEEMVKADTTLADSTYYARQLVAAATASPQLGVEYGARATQKFPNNPEFWATKAQAERKAAQLLMAEQSIKRALAIEPKYPAASLLLSQIYNDMILPDSVIALARRQIAAGEDSKLWGQVLLGPIQVAFKVAQDSANKTSDKWERPLALAQEADSLAPSTHTKFFVGVASFYVGYQAVNDAQKPKSCPLAKKGQNMFLLTQTKLPEGGRVEPVTARQILGYVAQLAPSADRMAKAWCK